MSYKNISIYFISEFAKDKNGNYIPCIAVRGTTGYYKTDWEWGKDFELAQELCDKKNAIMGITKKQAYIIQMDTMRGS